MVHQPLDDGRRREGGQRAERTAEREQLRRVDAAAGRHDMARAGHQVRDGVEAAAMRHRCAIDDGVAGAHRVDVDEIGQAHGQQVALRDHHALGPAGGAAGVEQPGQVVGAGVVRRGRCALAGGQRPQQRVGLGAFGVDLALQAGDRPGRDIARHEAPARATVADDPGDLRRVQLGIHRHDRQPGPPGAPQQLQVARVVAHEEQQPLARRQPGGTQPRRQRRGACGPLAVGGVQRRAVQDGGAIGGQQRLALQQLGEVHRRRGVGFNGWQGNAAPARPAAS